MGMSPPDHQEPTIKAIRVPAGRAELGCSMVALSAALAYFVSHFLIPFGKSAVAAVWLLPLIMLVVWPLAALFHKSVTVGDDGVELQSYLGKRFVSFGDIASISWFPGSLGKYLEMIPYQILIIRLHDGSVTIAWGFRPRVEQAFKDSSARHQWSRIRREPSPPAVLRAGKGAGVARIAELQSLVGREGATIRKAPIDRSRILDVALSPVADAGDRAAASIAVAPSASEAERQQIRIAAEACANQSLRIALNLALDPHASGEALALALAEVEADERVVGSSNAAR